MSRISTALLKNSTVQGSSLLIFLYSVIERGVNLAVKVKINDEKQERDFGAVPGQDIYKQNKAE